MMVARFLVFIQCVFLLLLSTQGSFAYGAEWRIVNLIGNKPECELDLPIGIYLKSSDFFERNRREVTGCAQQLALSGELTREDIGTLDKLLGFYQDNPMVDAPLSINLNSSGGSVSAALRIAEEIRDPASPFYQMSGFVGPEAQCLSACVIVLAATFHRTTLGRVGIHRPRFLPGEHNEMGYESLQSAYAGLYDQLERFFRGANIHPSFIDAMWSVPSSDMKYLTQQERRFYRLEGTDLVREEEQALRLIRVCGESGPAMQRDFLSTVNMLCRESSGRIKPACYSRIYNSHPYGRCDELLEQERAGSARR